MFDRNRKTIGGRGGRGHGVVIVQNLDSHTIWQDLKDHMKTSGEVKQVSFPQIQMNILY